MRVLQGFSESPLIGTSWTALEIAFNEENTTQISPNHNITLSFDSDRTHGSTGCNRYFGEYQQLSESSFSTSIFGLTRMYCQDTMVQEMNYMRFLRSRIFFYKIICTGESEDELILFDAIPGPEGELVQGEEVLARFRILNEDVE